MTKDQIKAIAKLVVAVKERNGKPVNVYVVAATIESFGIRDVDVKEDYGFDDIFQLSKYIYKAYDAITLANLKNNNQRKPMVISIKEASGLRSPIINLASVSL